MTDKYKTTTSLSGVELLQVAFIILKLCHVIKWSWWWVLAPTWISFLLAIFLVIILIAVKVANHE
jgi:hypothetical protein